MLRNGHVTVMSQALTKKNICVASKSMCFFKNIHCVNSYLKGKIVALYHGLPVVLMQSG